MTGPRVALVSLEPWDQVWRRNQHLVAELVGQQLVGSVVFIEPAMAARPTPPRHAAARRHRREPAAADPPAYRRAVAGRGLAAPSLAARRRSVVGQRSGPRGALRRRCRPAGVRRDRRLAALGTPCPGLTRRLVAAEDRLASVATTVVCSDVLAERWAQRYAVTATVVHNAASLTSYQTVKPGCCPAKARTSGTSGRCTRTGSTSTCCSKSPHRPTSDRCTWWGRTRCRTRPASGSRPWRRSTATAPCRPVTCRRGWSRWTPSCCPMWSRSSRCQPLTHQGVRVPRCRQADRGDTDQRVPGSRGTWAVGCRGSRFRCQR